MMMSLCAHSGSVFPGALTCEFALKRQVWLLVCQGEKIRTWSLLCCCHVLLLFCRKANDAVALGNDRVSTAVACPFFQASDADSGRIQKQLVQ